MNVSSSLSYTSIGKTAVRKCILVLGMHRSGTSALTRVLSLLGAALPKHLLPANDFNVAGYWEPEPLVTLHDRMLAEAGSQWNDWRAFHSAWLGEERREYYKAEVARIIAEEYGDASLFVIKDPRICRLLPFYQEVLTSLGVDTHYVMTFRNPLAVAQSLASRDGIKPPFADLIWLRHVLDAESGTRDAPRVFVSFERLLANWQDVVGAIGKGLGLAWPTPENVSVEAADILRPDLRHHAPSFEDLESSADTTAWVKDSYRALLALEKNAGAKSSLTVLHGIRTAFDAFTAAYGDAFFQELRAQADKLAKQQEQLLLRDSEVTRRQIEVDDLRQQLVLRDSDAKRQQIEIDLLRERVALRDAEADHQQSQIASLFRQIEDFEAKRI